MTAKQALASPIASRTPTVNESAGCPDQHKAREIFLIESLVPAATHSSHRNNDTRVDIHHSIERDVEFVEQAPERLGLQNGARKTVRQKTLAAI